MSAMFSQIFASMGPLIVTSSAGAMLGHLGQRTLGTYDLPVPRPGNVVQVVPPSIDAAATRVGPPGRRGPPLGADP